MGKGYFHPLRGYWQTTGEPPQNIIDGYPEGTVEVPVKPRIGYEWGGSEWVEQRASSNAEQRAAWRASAPSVTRTAFVLAAKRAGILTAEDAIIAAKGDWPDSFTPILDALPDNIDPLEAQIIWAATDRVYRLDPVLIAIGEHLSLTPESLDSLIGWAD